MRVAGHDLLTMDPVARAKLRGPVISMIFQEPMSALDPVFTIGEQIAETIIEHEAVDHRQAMRRALELLEMVKIPSAARRLKNYPHEMSGGMRQRAMIALALACQPSVLLADEPTTALDVTVQIQILLLLRELQKALGMAIVFVTHDVGVAAEIADRIAVMYGGRFVETGSAAEVMTRAPSSLHRRPAGIDRPWWDARPKTRDDWRATAQSQRIAVRLLLRAALPLRGRALRDSTDAGGSSRYGSHGALPAGGIGRRLMEAFRQ